MNERLKELAEQAGLYDEKSPDEVPEFTASFEKFAELLIKECAYIPIDMWDKAELNADVAVKIEDRIKQHFGVQE